MTTRKRASMWMDHASGRVTLVGALGLGGVLVSSLAYLAGGLPVLLYGTCVVAALVAYGTALAVAHLGDPSRGEARSSRARPFDGRAGLTPPRLGRGY